MEAGCRQCESLKKSSSCFLLAVVSLEEGGALRFAKFTSLCKHLLSLAIVASSHWESNSSMTNAALPGAKGHMKILCEDTLLVISDFWLGWVGGWVRNLQL